MSWGAIAAGALSAAGSFFGGEAANEANKQIAADANHFSELMSNTSYQRGMRDMKEAGLNPMLAYKQGGASTPTGQTFTAQDTISPAVANAMQGVRLSADVDNIRADVGLKAANTAVAESQPALNAANAKKALADAKLSEAQLPEATVRSKGWKEANKLIDQFLNGTAQQTAKEIQKSDWLRSNQTTRDQKSLGVPRPVPLFKD